MSDYKIYGKNKYSEVICDSYYAMSDTNNALYVYDKNRKVVGLYNKDNIYGVIEKNRVYNSYPEDITETKFMFEVIFDDNDTIIYVNADKYDHNVYTNSISFQAFVENNGKSYPITIGTFNLSNLIGIYKFYKSDQVTNENPMTYNEAVQELKKEIDKSILKEKPKFKIGDKVILVTEDPSNLVDPSPGTVNNIFENDDLVEVIWGNGYISRHHPIELDFNFPYKIEDSCISKNK